MVVSSTDDLPQDLGVIKTYNLVRDAFPAEADRRRRGRGGRRSPAGRRHRNRPAGAPRRVHPTRCCSGTEITYNDDGTVALVAIPTVGSGNDAGVRRALDEIRE